MDIQVIMKSDNIYNSIKGSGEVKSWNTVATFPESAHEVTRDEREAADARVALLIEVTKTSLQGGN